MTANATEMDRLKLELQALKEEKGVQDIYIGDYLLSRLEQLDVKVCVFIYSSLRD